MRPPGCSGGNGGDGAPRAGHGTPRRGARPGGGGGADAVRRQRAVHGFAHRSSPREVVPLKLRRQRPGRESGKTPYFGSVWTTGLLLCAESLVLSGRPRLRWAHETARARRHRLPVPRGRGRGAAARPRRDLCLPRRVRRRTRRRDAADLGPCGGAAGRPWRGTTTPWSTSPAVPRTYDERSPPSRTRTGSSSRPSTSTPTSATPGGPGTLPLHEPITEDVDLATDPEAYGPMKVACEQIVRDGAASASRRPPGPDRRPGRPDRAVHLLAGPARRRRRGARPGRSDRPGPGDRRARPRGAGSSPSPRHAPRATSTGSAGRRRSATCSARCAPDADLHLGRPGLPHRPGRRAVDGSRRAAALAAAPRVRRDDAALRRAARGGRADPPPHRGDVARHRSTGSATNPDAAVSGIGRERERELLAAWHARA